ncbi:hypothetical protein AB0B45_28885 [Nonomuraea sp. NPDC049152]|uniref:hypothetical protein n=1 Tax=Nonomuraea sp. NPDC049152 TaxID=3154350 RepID=UPI0033D2DB24
MGSGKFVTAASMVSSTIPVIPAVIPLAMLFWGLVAYPEKMGEGADHWKDSTPAHAPTQSTPSFVQVTNEDKKKEEWHPPMAGDDIKLLRDALKQLLTQAEKQQVWQGMSFDSFKKLALEFDGKLADLQELRLGVSGSLEAAKTAYDFLSDLLLTIASFVVALAAFTAASSVTPPTFITAHARALQILQMLYRQVGNIIGLMSKLTMKITFMMSAMGYTAIALTSQFPGMKPLKGTPPAFVQAKAVFDPAKQEVAKDPTADVQANVKPDMGGMSNVLPFLT